MTVHAQKPARLPTPPGLDSLQAEGVSQVEQGPILFAPAWNCKEEPPPPGLCPSRATGRPRTLGLIAGLGAAIVCFPVGGIIYCFDEEDGAAWCGQPLAIYPQGCPAENRGFPQSEEVNKDIFFESFLPVIGV